MVSLVPISFELEFWLFKLSSHQFPLMLEFVGRYCSTLTLDLHSRIGFEFQSPLAVLGLP